MTSSSVLLGSGKKSKKRGVLTVSWLMLVLPDPEFIDLCLDHSLCMIMTVLAVTLAKA